MVLQNIGSVSTDSVEVGCLDCPSWQDYVPWSATAGLLDRTSAPWAAADNATRKGSQVGLGLGLGQQRALADREENLRRNLPSFRVLRKLGTVGVVLITLAYAIHLVNPIEMVINMRMSFMNGSLLYGLWKKPPVQIYLQVYIFNITNPVEFLRGQQKLKMQEVGPYVYREEVENTNVMFNPNDTITYTPRRRVLPVPEMSIGDPQEQRVIVPNLALLGLASSLHNSSIFTNLAFATLSRYLDSQPFLHLSVHDFLWGFDDPLVHLASKIFPKWIHFPRIGLLDRMLDEGDNVVTMNVDGNADGNSSPEDITPPDSQEQEHYPRRAFAIDSWNGSPGLAHWGFQQEDAPFNGSATRCNTVRGATEGYLFPRNMRPDMRFSVYRKAFCRTLPLQFTHEGPTRDNVPAFWYKLADDIFETPDRNPDNSCLCRPHVAPCLPRGLSDLTPCYFDIPAAVSLPHFLDADERLVKAVEGLSPNRTRHGTSIAIQPRIGVPLSANIRVQTNLVIHKTKANPRVTRFNNLTLPILWVDLAVLGLPDTLNFLLRLLLVIAPIIQTSVIAGLAVVGGVLVLVTIAGVLCSAGMLHATGRRRPSIRTTATFCKYSQVKVIPEHLVSLSLHREDVIGKGRA